MAICQNGNVIPAIRVIGEHATEGENQKEDHCHQQYFFARPNHMTLLIIFLPSHSKTFGFSGPLPEEFYEC
jgi:hypothetical protein